MTKYNKHLLTIKLFCHTQPIDKEKVGWRRLKRDKSGSSGPEGLGCQTPDVGRHADSQCKIMTNGCQTISNQLAVTADNSCESVDQLTWPVFNLWSVVSSFGVKFYQSNLNRQIYIIHHDNYWQCSFTERLLYFYIYNKIGIHFKHMVPVSILTLSKFIVSVKDLFCFLPCLYKQYTLFG